MKEEITVCEYFPPDSIIDGKKIFSSRIVFNSDSIFDLPHVPMELSKAPKLASALDILGRFLYLTTEKTPLKIAGAKTKIVNEIGMCWINLNFYPMTRYSIHKKISDFIDDFRYITRNRWSNPNVSKQPKFNSCCHKVYTALLQSEFDIHTRDTARIKQLEKQHDMNKTQDDEKCLRDNVAVQEDTSLDLNWISMKQDSVQVRMY